MNRPLLKYCGNKSNHDYQLSLASDADYLGFIFADSKRRVKPEEVKQWIDEYGRKGKKLTGVFVHPSLEEAEEAASMLKLDAVQFHGEEDSALLEKFRSRNGAEIWKAIRHEESALQKMEAYAPFTDVFLIDSKVEGAWGGTGTAFDWSRASAYIQKAEGLGKICFIAGGITPENAESLLQQSSPHGIDLASGIESSGKKDRNLMKILEEKVSRYVSGY
ncbi:phosphoribosylanthranilate isomerase [Bacillus mangrovi]|uniref:N-(5'-phosphoribosyl)anthranilate isomerase n=1 Tax=Metabacillus mangrovi TaxID=1491830 RepID=A0A7X2V3L3_9BACI|nr:phosphoribosylanthranilate isomerase [Metabacillus mangrovi]MTH52169.1 phosphoribosylanthranilate isomerase [Metabacillus mangrovi]